MKSKHQVAVIIPVHNAIRYLPQAIDSVLGQSISPAEIVVVDDGSTDGSGEVARRYEPQVRYVHQANQGAAAARNKGVSLSQSEFIAFLDADDLWEPEKLWLQLQAFETRPQLEMVFCQIEEFVSSDTIRTDAGAPPPRGTAMPALLPSALMVRRSAFERIGLFSTEFGVGEFIDWYARASDAHVASEVVPRVLVHRRIHDTNQGVLKRDSYQREYMRILKKSLDRRRRQGRLSRP